MTNNVTLRQIAGMADQPAALADSTLIMIDCQNTYTQGVLELEGVQPALDQAAELLDRARSARIPIVHVMHDAGPGSPYDVRDQIGQIVDRVAPREGEPVVVKTVREIIDDCYADTEQTSLNALAARVGVTPAHLVRLFTETTGLSPHRYVVQTRIRRAEELLASGMSSSFVAAMTGFADQSHLTTQFKRYVGTTPAWYQRCRTIRPSAPDSDPLLPPSPPAPHWRRTPPPP